MRFYLLLTLCVCWFNTYSLGQEYQRAPQEVIRLMGDLREIHTPNGIHVLEEVELNGVKQWIQIRGKDKDNPVLVFLHGGPASPVMPISWSFQSTWEDFFTVVHWDQRGAGKNWIESDTTKLASQLQFRTLIQDAYVLVDYLCDRLEKDKVWILGYSYGSSIGIRMAARIPEKLHGYIGVGQMAPGKPEKIIYETLLGLARESKDSIALEELIKIDPYPAVEGPTPLKKTMIVRKWARKFHGGWYGKPNFNLYFSLPYLSSEYTDEEVGTLAKSSGWLTRRILANPGGGEWPTEFKVPVLIAMGRHDLHTPYVGAQSYFQQISSPRKKFLTLEWSGHVPFLEEPGKFLFELVKFTQLED